MTFVPLRDSTGATGVGTSRVQSSRSESSPMSKPTPSSSAAALALAGLLAGLPHAACAQVFKCRQADGSFSFQGSPCPGSFKPAAASAAARGAAPAASRPYVDPYAQGLNDGLRAALSSMPARRDPPAAPLDRSAAAPSRPSRDAAAERALVEEQASRKQQLAQALERERAANQAQRCDMARHNVEVLGRQRPVYRLDKKGERQYVSDENRDAELAAAKQSMATECR